MEYDKPIIQARVEIAPHYDAWMQGARYGTVKGLRQYEGQAVAIVKLDKMRKLKRIPVIDLKLI